MANLTLIIKSFTKANALRGTLTEFRKCGILWKNLKSKLVDGNNENYIQRTTFVKRNLDRPAKAKNCLWFNTNSKLFLLAHLTHKTKLLIIWNI